jgi:hypothetical protein
MGRRVKKEGGNMKDKRPGMKIGMAFIFGVMFASVFGHFVQTPRVAAQSDPIYEKVLAAEEFRLVDNLGKTRVSLRVDENGEFSLGLFDKEGNPTGTFQLSPDGRPSLTIGNKPNKK